MKITTTERVESPVVVQVTAENGAQAKAAAAELAKGEHICGAKVIRMDKRAGKADINVVYRIGKDVTLDVPVELGQRLIGLGYATEADAE